MYLKRLRYTRMCVCVVIKVERVNSSEILVRNSQINNYFKYSWCFTYFDYREE